MVTSNHKKAKAQFRIFKTAKGSVKSALKVTMVLIDT